MVYHISLNIKANFLSQQLLQMVYIVDTLWREVKDKTEYDLKRLPTTR